MSDRSRKPSKERGFPQPTGVEPDKPKGMSESNSSSHTQLDKSRQGKISEVKRILGELREEIERVEDREQKILNRAEDSEDSDYWDLARILRGGTKEGAAFKRSLKDLRMQISETLNRI